MGGLDTFAILVSLTGIVWFIFTVYACSRMLYTDWKKARPHDEFRWHTKWVMNPQISMVMQMSALACRLGWYNTSIKLTLHCTDKLQVALMRRTMLQAG